MKNTTFTVPLFCAIVLAACGGGGSSSSPTTNPITQQPVIASKLAAYAGSWVAACDGHELTSLTVNETSGATDTITIIPKTEYFLESGCSGTVVATETQSANYTMAYKGTADAGVVFSQGASSITTKIELVTLSAPALSVSITGSGVVHTINNGQAQWCMSFAGGNSSCVMDEGLEPAVPQTDVAMHVSGNKLYLLTPNGNIYAADEVYTRR